jgi:hypothetical protein
MDVGIISLELCEEFIGSGESTVGFANAGDSIDNEFVEAIISDEVEEATRELVEKGAFVVFDKVGMGFSCKG